MGLSSHRSRVLTQEESDFIRFQITLKGRPREVKAGLQRLCAHYDRRSRLADPHEHRLLVRALLWDELAIIRRWSYKTIAMIGERSDSYQLIQRLKTEIDLENQTWGIAAVIALSRDSELRKVCFETGFDYSVPLILAARLFAHQRWLQLNAEPPTINIEQAEPLTLKWAALLAGYGRAPTHLFHPAHENRVLLAKLNSHPVSEVSEYSVWTLWQHPTYEVQDLGISLHAVRGHPENVRRWINRLLTKNATFIGDNLDLFDDLRRDDAATAREGLALGLRQIYVAGLDDHVLDWHDDEPEELIRDLLLEHMAQGAENSLDYGDLVERSYKRGAQSSGIRQRLLAASRGQALYAALRRIDIAELAADRELALPQVQPLIGSMTVNNTTFRAGRDIVGQNLVGGDMIGSATQAVQHMVKSREQEQAILTDILRFLDSAKWVTEVDKEEATKVIESIANDGTLASKTGLLEVLKKIGAGATAIAGATDQVDRFIHTVSQWF
jgi:hypothetical protein